jgi:multiple sugar transport system ATP-binding protein
VEVVEPMGAEVFITLNTGAHAFTARLDSHKEARVGGKLEMVFDLPKAHFFDPQTKETIL